MKNITSFVESVSQLAKRSETVSVRCSNEESTKMFLVLPFLSLLGYDIMNPEEVYPEHHADFSDKYKNRVDYAILREGVPVVAIECKTFGAQMSDDRGQLRAYFNAVKTIKMAVLTDGMRWEFYADADEPNMMDAAPFLSVNMSEVAAGRGDNQVVALMALTKQMFQPDSVGAEAKRKHLTNSAADFLQKNYKEPSDDFTRIVLSESGVGRFSKNRVSEYREIVRDAFRLFVNNHILARLDITEEKTAVPAEKAEDVVVIVPKADGVDTTAEEVAFYESLKRRLAFLVDDEKLFREIEKVQYRDYRGKFVVFYDKERKGRLLDLLGYNEKDGYRIQFPEVADMPMLEVVVKSITAVDERILRTFMSRVLEST